MMRSLTVLILLLVFVFIVSAQEATPEAEGIISRIDEFGIEQVWVDSGCFIMGTTDEQAAYAESLEAPEWAVSRIFSEQPAHEVCLTEGYWIDRYEVTNESFNAFIAAGGYDNQEYWSSQGWSWMDRRRAGLPAGCHWQDEATYPRACITWYEAEAYAAWRGGALPTEAQWEYAARGTESLIYPWGNEWDASLANVVGTESMTAVGTYPDGASWVGAEDMAGNVMEWVQDWISDTYYAESPVENPTGVEQGRRKAEKGGWWGSNAFVARSAYHHFEDTPTYQDHHIGFRIVTTDAE